MLTPKAECYSALLGPTWMSPKLPCLVMASPPSMIPLPRHSISYLSPDFCLLESTSFHASTLPECLQAASSLVPLPPASPSQPTAPSCQRVLAEAKHRSPPHSQMPTGESQPLQLRVCLLCSHLHTLSALVLLLGMSFLLWSVTCPHLGRLPLAKKNVFPASASMGLLSQTMSMC